MRKKIIAIGILAVIAVCATLAIADEPPTRININSDGVNDTRIVFLNFNSNDTWTVDFESDEIDNITGIINYSTNGIAYYVTLVENCITTPVGCNGVCASVVPGTYNITAFVFEPDGTTLIDSKDGEIIIP